MSNFDPGRRYMQKKLPKSDAKTMQNDQKTMQNDPKTMQNLLE